MIARVNRVGVVIGISRNMKFAFPLPGYPLTAAVDVENVMLFSVYDELVVEAVVLVGTSAYQSTPSYECSMRTPITGAVVDDCNCIFKTALSAAEFAPLAQYVTVVVPVPIVILLLYVEVATSENPLHG